MEYTRLNSSDGRMGVNLLNTVKKASKDIEKADVKPESFEFPKGLNSSLIPRLSLKQTSKDEMTEQKVKSDFIKDAKLCSNEAKKMEGEKPQLAIDLYEKAIKLGMHAVVRSSYSEFLDLNAEDDFQFVVEQYTNLSNLLKDIDKEKSADMILKAADLKEKLGQDNKDLLSQSANLYLDIAKEVKDIDKEKSADMILKAADLKEKLGQDNKDLLNQSANLYLDIAKEVKNIDKEKSADMIIKAADLKEKLGQDNKDLLNQSANLYLDIAKEVKNIDKEKSADLILKAANIYLKIDDMNPKVNLYEQALSEYMELINNTPDPNHKGELYIKIAKIYENMSVSQSQNIELSYLNAIECFKKSNNSTKIFENCKKLGEYYEFLEVFNYSNIVKFNIHTKMIKNLEEQIKYSPTNYKDQLYLKIAKIYYNDHNYENVAQNYQKAARATSLESNKMIFNLKALMYYYLAHKNNLGEKSEFLIKQFQAFYQVDKLLKVCSRFTLGEQEVTFLKKMYPYYSKYVKNYGIETLAEEESLDNDIENSEYIEEKRNVELLVEQYKNSLHQENEYNGYELEPFGINYLINFNDQMNSPTQKSIFDIRKNQYITKNDIKNMTLLMLKIKKIDGDAYSEFQQNVEKLLYFYRAIEGSIFNTSSDISLDDFQDTQIRAIYDSFKHKPSPEQMNAITRYKNSAIAFNALLSGTFFDYKKGETLCEICDGINYLTDCIANYELKESITVYRGEGYHVLNSVNINIQVDGQTINKSLGKLLEEIKSYPKYKRDKYINAIKDYMSSHELSAEQERFMSTSALKSECSFGELNWEITLPKGTNALYLETSNLNKAYAEQAEFLIQRGAKIIIDSIEFNENSNTWDCKCRVITTKEKPENLKG